MDEGIAQIPAMQKPVSVMEHGPNSQNLAASSAARHPVDTLQRSMAAAPFSNLDYVRSVYGSGLAMRLATEQKIAAQQEGHAPLARSNLYREIVTGNDIKLDFADYLNLPENQPDIARENLHISMERKLGL